MRCALAICFLLAAPPQDGQWHRWVAWYPVYVDAYDVSEIRDGKMSYRVWLQTVDARFDTFVDDDDDRTIIQSWKYRLVK